MIQHKYMHRYGINIRYKFPMRETYRIYYNIKQKINCNIIYIEVN